MNEDTHYIQNNIFNGITDGDSKKYKIHLTWATHITDTMLYKWKYATE